MAEEPVYNLLQAIDPSKIKVPISEKFSKLTLSSSKKKKKQEASGMGTEIKEKRDSASRNLMKQLSQPSGDKDSSPSNFEQHTNPLLCSGSSKDRSNSIDINHLGEYYETSMDSLNVTEDEANLTSQIQSLDVEALSRKVSALSVVCHRHTSPASASSNPLNDVTQLISTESQRSSMVEIQKFNTNKMPIKIFKREKVAISSSSSSVGNDDTEVRVLSDNEGVHKSVDNISDCDYIDDAEYTDEEDDVITISDSSHSATAEGQTSMCVSTLRTLQAGERTIREFRQHLQLPLPNLSPAKLERLAAFLRDVSMEHRNRAENGNDQTEDSICNQYISPEEKVKKIDKASPEYTLPKGEKEGTLPTRRGRQQGLTVLEGDNNKEKYDDKSKRLATAGIQSNAALTEMNTNLHSPKNRNRRLVSADTVENSLISFIESDSSMSLQVTPTPSRGAEEVTKYMYNETEENTLMTQMTGLNIKSPAAKTTPDSTKECGRYQNRAVELGSSEMPRKNQKSAIETNKAVRRLASVETESNTFLGDQSCDLNFLKTEQKDTNTFGSSETKDNNIMKNTAMPMFKNVPFPNKPAFKRGERRLVSADTEDNTMSAEIQDNNLISNVPIFSSKLLPYSPKMATRGNERRLASADTEENTLSISGEIPDNNPKIHALMSSTAQSYLPKTLTSRGERRLVSADTEENTMSELHLSNSITSLEVALSENNPLILASDDTKSNSYLETSQSPEMPHKPSNFSLPSSPVYKTPQRKFTNNSIRSIHTIISSSSEDLGDGSAPEHSVTILETDDDDEDSAKCSPTSKCTQSHEDNKLSSSFHENEPHVDTDGQYSSKSKIQMSMASINISAKINIKITIPHSTETSEDDESAHTINEMLNTDSFSENRQNVDKSAQGKKFNLPKRNKNTKKAADSTFDTEEIILKSDESNAEDEDFVNTAAKLLTQLYGDSWQTPDVMRNLRKSHEDGGSTVRPTSNITKRKPNDKNQVEISSNVVEESILGDFSTFRKNIVKTNSLDSTRLYTPKPKISEKNNTRKECQTEPRKIIKKHPEFELPQTGSRRGAVRIHMAKVSASQIRSQNERWRQLLVDDSGSESNNASDDDECDKSDATWKSSNIESEESDTDISTGKPQTKSKKSASKTQTNSVKTKKIQKGKEKPVANITESSETKGANAKKLQNKLQDGEILYLDLSNEEVKIQEVFSESPPANHDETFASKLNEILKTCQHEDKPKMRSSAQSTKSKRKLFTPIFGQDVEADLSFVVPEQKEAGTISLSPHDDGLVVDDATCPFDARGKPKKLVLYNRQLEAVKAGKPVFQLSPSPKKTVTPSRTTHQENVNENTTKSRTEKELKIKNSAEAKKEVGADKNGIRKTPDFKYCFLKSLDATVSNNFCHPDARIYRDSYRTKKEELSRILYDLYNEKLFKNELNVPISWNKKLLNTAGRCLNKKKLGVRSSVIELSEKVLTSADRLRCTLIHELCHAATWVFNGEGGHGRTWKEWAHKANATFPELPKIGVCHQYEIEYKYTYKCTLCAAKSHAHSKSKKIENIRCSYCHGAIEIFLNKKDKDGNIMPTPVKEATGFAKFVKDNYKIYKRDDIKHADVMKILSGQFSALKLQNQK